MGQFKYTLPSGATFELQAPTGTTQAQADFVFYSQVASGSLVGYTIGQTLSSLESKLTKFGLSRLDRGTAGVDTLAILAIIDETPVIASIPNLTNIALQNPITAADYIATGPVDPVGPLSPEETQALVTQISNLVDQPPDVVSTDGVGEYGLGPEALENAGYLKPGTSNYPDYNCVVGSPGVWTGKNGVYNLVDVLTNPELQTKMQTEIMQNSYNSLTASGTIQTTTTAPASTSTGQVYTGTGALATVTAATLLAGTAAVNGTLNNLITSSFANAPNISSLLSNPVDSISTLANGAVNSVTQSIANLPGNALNYANNLVSGTLNTLTGTASSLVNTALNSTVGQGLNVVNGLATSAASIANGVNGAVGGLIANASQFGAPVTALWAQGSGLLNSALGSASGLATNITGAVSGLAGSALSTVSGAIGGVTSQVSGLLSGALSSVTGQAQELLSSLGGNLDIFGKMGSFSIDFSLFSSDSLVSATKVAAGYSNTVNRQTVDAAVTRILGNPKIPTPTFEYPSPAAVNLGADISYAQNKLKEITGQITGAVGTATSALTTFAGGASSTGIGTGGFIG